jgi:hypothetical protein
VKKRNENSFSFHLEYHEVTVNFNVEQFECTDEYDEVNNVATSKASKK